MTTQVAPSHADILQGFRLLDERLADGAAQVPLRALRARLVGELICDADIVEPTLAADFELVTHAAGARTVSDRAEVLAGLRGLGATPGSAFVWVTLADLVADERLVAAHGVLHTLVTAPLAAAQGHSGIGADDLCHTASPVALFVNFDGALMTAETLYMDAGASTVTVLPNTTAPSIDHLRELADA